MIAKNPKLDFWIRTALHAVLTVGVAVSMSLAMADDDEDEEEEHEGRRGSVTQTLPPTPVNAKFKTECSSCHMLYPADLLPERSWRKMMDGLDKHFGETATLDDITKKEITDYLVKNAADRAPNRRSQKFLATIPKNQAPLRFSDSAYFNRKHDEISEKVFQRKAIGSRANCLACHPGAESSRYSEREIRIPKDAPAESAPSPKTRQ